MGYFLNFGTNKLTSSPGSMKILLYGDVNMNIIDGSSIWLKSLTQTLSINHTYQIYLLLKARPERDLLIKDLFGIKNVTILNPFELFPEKQQANEKMIRAADTTELIQRLDDEYKFNLIILRGFDLCEYMVHQFAQPKKIIPYITDFTFRMKSVSKEDINRINRIYEKVDHMFAQTPQMIDFYKKIIISKEDKFKLLPPMIPDYPDEKPAFQNKNNALVYVGKFAKEWNVHKLLKAYANYPGIKLNVAGDKFQADLSDIRQEMIDILENNRNINWLKGISREQCDDLIAASDIGISWRSQNVDNDHSVHLSTKVLEYGRLGKPVIIRRTLIHEELLGPDYPLFADDETEMIVKVQAVLTDPDLYKKAAFTVYTAGSYYTFSNSYKRLKPVIESYRTPDRSQRLKKAIKRAVNVFFKS